MEDVKSAVIQIGEREILNNESHIYVYPEDITEHELIIEICYLKEFYDSVQVQLPLPPHIRHEVTGRKG